MTGSGSCWCVVAVRRRRRGGVSAVVEDEAHDVHGHRNSQAGGGGDTVLALSCDRVPSEHRLYQGSVPCGRPDFDVRGMRPVTDACSWPPAAREWTRLCTGPRRQAGKFSFSKLGGADALHRDRCMAGAVVWLRFGAGLSDPPDHHDRPVRSRRTDRHDRPTDRPRHVEIARTTDHRREHDGGRRHDRHGPRGARGAGRLHAADPPCRHGHGRDAVS